MILLSATQGKVPNLGNRNDKTYECDVNRIEKRTSGSKLKSSSIQICGANCTCNLIVLMSGASLSDRHHGSKLGSVHTTDVNKEVYNIN